MEDQNSSQKMRKVNNWFQENLRVIISIVIVIAIAGGVYSYSQRNSNQNKSEEKKVAINTLEEKNNNQENESAESEIEASSTVEESSVTKETPKEEVNTTEENAQPQKEDRTSSISTSASQETEESFVETAGAGDGLTHLARRSLANYLEKNPDSSLTAEHKVYIEDYLRKNVTSEKIKVGTSVEFSKSLIADAIEKSKQLNEKQLNNLKKYSAQVSF